MGCSRQSGGLCQATFKPLLRHPKHSSHLEGNSSFLFTQALTLETAFTHWYSHSPRTTGQDVLSTLLSNYFPESNFFSLPWELPSCLTLPSSLAWISDGAPPRLLPREADAAGPGTKLGQ